MRDAEHAIDADVDQVIANHDHVRNGKHNDVMNMNIFILIMLMMVLITMMMMMMMMMLMMMMMMHRILLRFVSSESGRACSSEKVCFGIQPSLPRPNPAQLRPALR